MICRQKLLPIFFSKIICIHGISESVFTSEASGIPTLTINSCEVSSNTCDKKSLHCYISGSGCAESGGKVEDFCGEES